MLPEGATFARLNRPTAMRIRPLQALFPNFDYVASPDSFCADAKDLFREFQQNGFFEKNPAEGMFVYEIEAPARRHLGLVAMNDVRDFFEGNIRKHENTLHEKEQQQMQMFLRWKAVLKPVLLTYPPVPAIGEWLENFAAAHPPLFAARFEREDQTHRVWLVADPADQAALQGLFARCVPRTYIADGHHRTSTVALLYERLREKKAVFDFSQLFCAFFASDQLEILDFNRVVHLPSDWKAAQFVVKLSRLFELDLLTEPRKPREKHELTLLFHGEWYSLRWRPEVLASVGPGNIALDAALLDAFVLRDVLGIRDVRTDARVAYVEGARGLEGFRRAVGERTDRAGFLLYPVSFADMMSLADAGEVLPPKSTYFEPRMKSGMLVKRLK